MAYICGGKLLRDLPPHKNESTIDYIMDSILAIQELADKILSGNGLSNEIRMIAALRMVCRQFRDVFATVIGIETRTRCGVTYAATTYTVRDFFGCTPYYTGKQKRREFLEEIQIYGDRRISECEFASVIHAYGGKEGCFQVGFNLGSRDFADLNRLFNLRSESYELLVREHHGLRQLRQNCTINVDAVYLYVKIVGTTYQMEPYFREEKYAAYYRHAGQIYGCDENIGIIANADLLEKLTW